MTISSTTNRISTNGNNTTTAFPVSFPFHAQADLTVESVIIATGVSTTQALGSDYTISGTTDSLGHYPNGGTVNFAVAPASTVRIVIYRDPPQTQATDLIETGNLPAESLEATLDYLTMLLQRVSDRIGRTLHQPDGDETSVGALPTAVDRAGKYLSFDGSGDPITSTTIDTNTVTVSPFMETVLDDASAATARTTLGAVGAEQTDSTFRVIGSSDATKKLAFEVDTNVTTATTRTVTVQDQSGTMALLTDAFTTGDVKLTLKTTADATWVLMDDKSIGDASSGATGRANADTEDLYTLIWTNVTDQWAPVVGGRGASAAADFAAHKALALPKTLGRALAGYGTGTVSDSGGNADVDTGAANSLTVPSNNTKWITGMSVVFTLASGTITGLSSGNTYYVIRSSSTLISLASTLALAQAGTAIDLTAKSSPVWTVTHTYTARVLGEAIGEISHAMSSTELYAHTHAPTVGGLLIIQDASGYGIAGGGSEGAGSLTTAGGNVAMNNMQPTLFLNVMVKL